ncbi:MAG TPA: FecR family protein [Spirochaetia bacterium]|nr:FecR family protein [Spirochaetia bacterium]
MKNARCLYALVAALFLIVAGCTRKESLPDGAADTVRERAVELVFFDGEVLVDGKTPELGARLGFEFTIRTGAGARCDIVFDGGNALSVGQNAFISFDFSRLMVVVDIERGGLGSVLKKLDKIAGTDSFRIQTQSSIAGVRGTSFCVWVGPDSTYVCACNGRVRTIDAFGNNEELLEAAHHQARLYKRAGSNISVEEAGMLHHDDAMIQSVADRIGYRIDWTKIDD